MYNHNNHCNLCIIVLNTLTNSASQYSYLPGENNGGNPNGGIVGVVLITKNKVYLDKFQMLFL